MTDEPIDLDKESLELRAEIQRQRELIVAAEGEILAAQKHITDLKNNILTPRQRDLENLEFKLKNLLGTQRIDVHIRWMIRRDMLVVLDIENGSFEFPWSEEDFLRCLRQRNCIGMVAEYDGRVLGFMVYERHKDQLHVLNFAVRPDVRGYDVGRQMVETLVGKLSHEERARIVLEVRETNVAAQIFLKNVIKDAAGKPQGFRATSVLSGYYNDTNEDSYVMEYRLNGFEQDPSYQNSASRDMPYEPS